MNNHCVPDWNMEDETRSLLFPPANQRKSLVADDELIELLWRNGHVVMQSQTHRKPLTTVTECKQAQKPEPPMKCGGSLGNSSDLIQEDETASWFQYPLDDSLEKEFCSELFCEMPTADAISAEKLNKVVPAAGEFGVTGESNVLTGSGSKHSDSRLHENVMSPPKSHVTGSNQQAPSLGNGEFVNFSHFSRPMKADLGFLTGQLGQKGSENGIEVGMGESSSTMTVDLSACGGSRVQNLVDESHTFSKDATGAFARSVKEDVHARSPHEGVQTNTYETTVTSSSGGSGCSFGRREQKKASNQRYKRKGRDGEESECHSEEAEYEFVEANKSTQRSASARKSRAAEVHNLSERKRRDRINEKMRALQELIPHCNKSDKASMLDEAIEYLKSLQLQVQIMWMGSGMAPMMFPGVQQYMSWMGMGMAHAPIPSIRNPIQLPTVPPVNQFMPSALTANQTPVHFPTQLPNVHFPESYARYHGFHHMQPSPQAYGSHEVKQNQPSPAAASSSRLPTAGVVPGKIQTGHSGTG